MKKVLNRIKPHLYILNICLFILKILVFIFTKSFLFLISSLYNLCIGIAKQKVYSKNSKYFLVGLFIIFASICFILYSIWIIIIRKDVNYNLYTALLISSVTFFDIIYSIYGIVKENKNGNIQNKTLKQINLVSALISLQLTQSSLLSFTTMGNNSFYNGLLGIIVGIISLFIGIIVLNKNFKKST